MDNIYYIMDSSSYAHKYMKYKLKYKNLQKSIIQAGGNKYRYRLRSSRVFFVFSDHEEVPLNAAQKEALYKFTEKFEPGNWSIITDMIYKPPEYVIDFESNFDMGSVFIAENPVSGAAAAAASDSAPIYDDIHVINLQENIQKLNEIIEEEKRDLKYYQASDMGKPGMPIDSLSEIHNLISRIKSSIKLIESTPSDMHKFKETVQKLKLQFEKSKKWVDENLPPRSSYVFKPEWEGRKEKPLTQFDEANATNPLERRIKSFLENRMEGVSPAKSQPILLPRPVAPYVVPSVSQPVAPPLQLVAPPLQPVASSALQPVAPLPQRISRPPPFPPSDEQKKRQTEQERLAQAQAQARAEARAQARARAQTQPADQTAATPSAAAQP